MIAKRQFGKFIDFKIVFPDGRIRSKKMKTGDLREERLITISSIRSSCFTLLLAPFGFGCFGLEPGDKLLDLILFLLLLDNLLLFLMTLQLLCLQKLIVVARIDFYRLVIDVHDMCTDAIEEVLIMRNDETRPLKLQRIFLQPDNRKPIEMVGGFVQKREISSLNKH